jgi:hypothetical protein
MLKRVRVEKTMPGLRSISIMDAVMKVAAPATAGHRKYTAYSIARAWDSLTMIGTRGSLELEGARLIARLLRQTSPPHFFLWKSCPASYLVDGAHEACAQDERDLFGTGAPDALIQRQLPPTHLDDTRPLDGLLGQLETGTWNRQTGDGDESGGACKWISVWIS